MNLEEIIAQYAASEKVQQLQACIDEQQDVHLGGLCGAMDAFILAAAIKGSRRPQLIVLPTREDAAYFQNTLSVLFDKKDIHFFPDSWKRLRHYDEISNTQVQQRTEVIHRLQHPLTASEVVVTYPEAIAERVVQLEETAQKTLVMKCNEPLDIDFMIDVLIEMEFERVDFVYEPGQFSIRGGIIDIYSFAHEYPYRIELSGDDIESLRLFDPTTQLSVKKVSAVHIVPHVVQQAGKEKQVPLTAILPPQTVIWVRQFGDLLDVIRQCRETVERQREKWQQHAHPPADHPLLREGAGDIYIQEAEWINGLKPLMLAEFGPRPYYAENRQILWQSRPQPSFNKNFPLLIDDFRKNTAAGYQNFLFADNPKQIERFYSIFEDLKAQVSFIPVYKSIHQGFIDDEQKWCCYTDHQIFNRYHKYQLRQGFSKDRALLVRMLQELKPGDFVTHIDHGVGVYSGLEKIEINGQAQEAVRLVYAGNDLLYVSINSLHKISKYVGKEGTQPRIHKLGADAWVNLKRKTKRKIREIAFDLIALYAKRKARKGFAFSPDNFMQTELESSFMYEDTPDQAKATEDVKRDMEKASPMDRLVCGDVGFGKTEIAVRAAMKAVSDNKQVAVLVPTTILALQHYKTFRDRFSDFPVEVDYLNRFKTAAEKKETLARLAEGKVQIIIGTHGLIGKQVKFKDLGLMIVDEEQKFGVGVKETLKTLREQVDSLTLTATPIPRTLQFSLMGARDLSIMHTPPPNRQPITTEVRTLDPDVIREAILFEVYRGGQVFFVHNRVKDIVEVQAMLQKIVPQASIGVVHGQMEGDHLEDMLLRFINREFDVLLSTNIIESGIDISNANTIIINNAHQFGLSDLHQLRGRVGRNNKNAFCYLLAPPMHSLTNEARQRLRTLEEFSDLGGGFQIAMRDLDIRGAGNLLGGEQSGFIADIGYDVYQKILDEAIRELKNTEFKELYTEELNETHDYVSDTTVETDVEMLIPEQYVKSTAERMLLYRELNDIANEEGLEAFEQMLSDRFGKVPASVYALFDAMRLKWVAAQLGMERVILKNRKLRCYFTDNKQAAFYASEVFQRIIQYVAKRHQGVYLRETDKNLILNFDDVVQVQQALQCLHALREAVA